MKLNPVWNPGLRSWVIRMRSVGTIVRQRRTWAADADRGLEAAGSLDRVAGRRVVSLQNWV